MQLICVAETINLNNYPGRHYATFTIGLVYRIPEDHMVRQRLDRIIECGIRNAEGGNGKGRRLNFMVSSFRIPHSEFQPA
jgi:hypothetical protein